MGEGVADINLAAQPPAVILMAGLQGAGKTTTTAKLAKHLIEKRKKKVLTVSADVYRPAAIEQLKTVTKQAGAEWFPSTPDREAARHRRAPRSTTRSSHYFDVLLVDTAGRLAIDEKLMAEISELHAALNPVETLFVVDAMQGQDAINTAKAFKEALPLTGIVLTKIDGDSRGGAALSVRADHRRADQVRRHQREDRRPRGVRRRAPRRPRARHGRHRRRWSRRCTKGVDVAAAQKLADKVKAGDSFDLNDFLSQISADEEDGRPRRPDGQAAHAADRQAPSRPGRHGPGRARHAPHGRHHLLDDAAGAPQARAAQGHAQAPHRRAAPACRCRRSTACSTSSSRCAT